MAVKLLSNTEIVVGGYGAGGYGGSVYGGGEPGGYSTITGSITAAAGSHVEEQLYVTNLLFDAVVIEGLYAEV